MSFSHILKATIYLKVSLPQVEHGRFRKNQQDICWIFQRWIIPRSCLYCSFYFTEGCEVWDIGNCGIPSSITLIIKADKSVLFTYSKISGSCNLSCIIGIGLFQQFCDFDSRCSTPWSHSNRYRPFPARRARWSCRLRLVPGCVSLVGPTPYREKWRFPWLPTREWHAVKAVGSNRFNDLIKCHLY